MDPSGLIRQELGQIITILNVQVKMKFFKETPEEMKELVSKLEEVAHRFGIDLDGYESVKFSELKTQLQQYINTP